eukprot:78879_1
MASFVLYIASLQAIASNHPANYNTFKLNHLIESPNSYLTASDLSIVASDEHAIEHALRLTHIGTVEDGGVEAIDVESHEFYQPNVQSSSSPQSISASTIVYTNMQNTNVQPHKSDICIQNPWIKDYKSYMALYHLFITITVIFSIKSYHRNTPNTSYLLTIFTAFMSDSYIAPATNRSHAHAPGSVSLSFGRCIHNLVTIAFRFVIGLSSIFTKTSLYQILLLSHILFTNVHAGVMTPGGFPTLPPFPTVAPTMEPTTEPIFEPTLEPTLQPTHVGGFEAKADEARLDSARWKDMDDHDVNIDTGIWINTKEIATVLLLIVFGLFIAFNAYLYMKAQGPKQYQFAKVPQTDIDDDDDSELI